MTDPTWITALKDPPNECKACTNGRGRHRRYCPNNPEPTAGGAPRNVVWEAARQHALVLARSRELGRPGRNEDRCPMSDLLWGECALPCCRPDLAHIVMTMAPQVVAGTGADLDEPDHEKPTRHSIKIYGHDARCKQCDAVIPMLSLAMWTSDRGVLCIECGGD